MNSDGQYGYVYGYDDGDVGDQGHIEHQSVMNKCQRSARRCRELLQRNEWQGVWLVVHVYGICTIECDAKTKT